MRSISGWGLLTSAAAPILLIGGWTLAARLQPGEFDQVTDTISALAAEDAAHRWVMTTALAGVGAAHIGTALALHQVAPAARWVLAAGGLATALVAAYPLPADGGPAPEHAATAGVAFLALASWPAIASLRARPPEATGLLSRRAGVAASGVLLGVLGWFVAELVQDGPRIGLSERAAAGSQALWPLVVVLAARRSRRHS